MIVVRSLTFHSVLNASFRVCEVTGHRSALGVNMLE